MPTSVERAGQRAGARAKSGSTLRANAWAALVLAIGARGARVTQRFPQVTKFTHRRLETARTLVAVGARLLVATRARAQPDPPAKDQQRRHKDDGEGDF